MKNIFLTALSKFFCQVQWKDFFYFHCQIPHRNRNSWGFFPVVSIVVSWISSLSDIMEMVCAARGSVGVVGWRLRAGWGQAANKSFPSESSAVDAPWLQMQRNLSAVNSAVCSLHPSFSLQTTKILELSVAGQEHYTSLPIESWNAFGLKAPLKLIYSNFLCELFLSLVGLLPGLESTDIDQQPLNSSLRQQRKTGGHARRFHKILLFHAKGGWAGVPQTKGRQSYL